MDGTSGDQKLISDRRVTNSISDLDFHLAFQDHDQLIGGMGEILSAPSRRIGQKVASETTL
jgi:hypothetical protein